MQVQAVPRFGKIYQIRPLLPEDAQRLQRLGKRTILDYTRDAGATLPPPPTVHGSYPQGILNHDHTILHAVTGQEACDLADPTGPHQDRKIVFRSPQGSD